MSSWRSTSTLTVALLLASCASVQPSTQPVTAETRIRVVRDTEDSARCNRTAFEVLALRRSAYDVATGVALSKAWEDADVAEARAVEAEKAATASAWWRQWGPMVAVSVGVAGLVLGFVGGFSARR